MTTAESGQIPSQGMPEALNRLFGKSMRRPNTEPRENKHNTPHHRWRGDTHSTNNHDIQEAMAASHQHSAHSKINNYLLRKTSPHYNNHALIAAYPAIGRYFWKQNEPNVTNVNLQRTDALHGEIPGPPQSKPIHIVVITRRRNPSLSSSLAKTSVNSSSSRHFRQTGTPSSM